MGQYHIADISDVSPTDFRAVQRSFGGMAGFVCCAYWTDAPLDSAFYWHEGGSMGGYLQRFNEPTCAVLPHIYLTKHGFERRLAKMKLEQKMGLSLADSDNLVIGPVFWVHPDRPSVPLAKYQQIRVRFPGCPTQ
jgi:hypothetical protein